MNKATEANLCKCNGCGNVLIDKNAKPNATIHALTGEEREMIYRPTTGENLTTEYFWACPVCLTDEFLFDL